jgi:hypothetical protein
MKRAAVLAYLLALHAAVGWLAWKIDHRPTRLEFMREAHARMDASIPAGACLFLGDSITQGLATAAVCDRSVNLGIGSQSTRELAASMRAYHALARAGRVFVMSGANDRGAGDFMAIARQLPAGTPVVWSGAASLDGSTRGDAAKAQAACATLRGCTYIDTQALLDPLGADAYLDGLHLSPKGYAAWIAALKSASAQKPAAPPTAAPSR